MADDNSDVVVLPGDVIGKVTTEIRLGSGLTQLRDDIVSTRAGVLRERHGDRYWVDSSQKRYVPTEGDLVLGIITGRQAEGYSVDLGSAFEATLAFEEFEGATKRNKPTWEVGDLVYARVTVANRDMDPELSCVNSRGKAAGFGGLVGGFMFRCSIGLARSLLAPNCFVVKCLGKQLAYEMAVGMNGRVWVKTGSHRTTIMACTALQNSEFLSSNEEIVAMVNAMKLKE